MNKTNISVIESTLSTVYKTSAYCVLLLLSLVGNSLVIAIVYRERKMRTFTNCWITNMAASDLLFPLVAFPHKIIQIFTGDYVWLIHGAFGLAMCKLVMFFGDVSTAVSIQSMVFIAVERFCAVKFPLHVGAIQTKMKFFIPTTWLVGLVLHSPYFYTAKLVSYGGKMFCISSFAPAFDEWKAQRFYFLLIFVLLYAIPLAVLVVLYTSIILQLKGSKLPVQDALTSERRQRKLRNQNNWNVIKMSLVIVFTFFLCFSLLIFSMFLLLFGKVAPSSKVRFAMFFLAQSYPAWNPIVYFIFSNNFRNGLKHICLKGKSETKSPNITLASWLSRASS